LLGYEQSIRSVVFHLWPGKDSHGITLVLKIQFSYPIQDILLDSLLNGEIEFHWDSQSTLTFLSKP